MPRKRRPIKSVIREQQRRSDLPREMRKHPVYCLARHWAQWEAAAEVAGIDRNTFINCVCNHMAEQILGERAQQKQIDLGNYTVTRVGAENADPRPEQLPESPRREMVQAEIRDAWDGAQRAEGVAGITRVDQIGGITERGG